LSNIRTLNANKTANLLLLLASVLFIAWALKFIQLTSFVAINGERHYALFDDAMISMRYAWNFTHGNGLVWNAGEPVEGYTNLLMVLVMAIPNGLFEQRIAVLCVQLFGIVTMLGSAVLTSRIVPLFLPDVRYHAPAKVISFVAVLLYYPLVYWSLMGMETGLMTLLFLAAIYLLLSYQKTGDKRQIYAMALLLGLCYLTRPESLMLSGMLLLYFLVDCWVGARHDMPVQKIFVVFTLFAALPIMQHLFRWWYYGELFSNTYTLKANGLPLGERIGYGWDYTAPFLKEHGLLLIITIAGVVKSGKTLFWGNRDQGESANRPYNTILFAAMIAVMIAYQIFIGGEPIEWTYWRVVVPVMPLLLILVIAALTSFYQSRSSRLILLSTVAVGTVALLYPLSRYADERTFTIPPYQSQLNTINVNKALLIDAITTDEASIGVSWGGMIPYYNPRLYAIDYLGKSDLVIAELMPYPDDPMRNWPGHNKHDLSYSIQTLQPTFSETFTYTIESVEDWGQRHYAALVYGQDIILYFKLGAESVDWQTALELGLFPWLQWNTEVLLPDWLNALDADAVVFMPVNSYGIGLPETIILANQLDTDALQQWQVTMQPEHLQAAGIGYVLVDSNWWQGLSVEQQAVFADPAAYALVEELQIGSIFLRLYRLAQTR
jgi:arabinofuranosyltransferase